MKFLLYLKVLDLGKDKTHAEVAKSHSKYDSDTIKM